MFTPVLLICSLDYSICWGQASSMLLKTEDECLSVLARGIEIYEEQNFLIESYQCVYWGEKA